MNISAYFTGLQGDAAQIHRIEILDGRREINPAAVKRLANSINKIGLRTPVTVRRNGDDYTLVAGRHRIEAFKQLDRDIIPITIINKMTAKDARLWEISENLDRAELTKLERDEQVAEWIRLTEEASSQVATKPKDGRPESGVRAAARELGVDKDDAHRAVKVASLSDEAKAAAREHGLDNNRSAMLAAAGESEPKDQVAKINELAAVKTKPKPVYSKKEMAAREKAREARFDKENLKVANAMTEAFIAAGEMSDQQIADFRERGIIPPFRLFSPCGMAFDGGAPYAQASCDPTPVEPVAEPVNNGMIIDINEEWREPLVSSGKILGVPTAEYIDILLLLGSAAFNRKFHKGLTSHIKWWLVEMHSKYPDTFNVGSWEGSCGHLSIDNLRAQRGTPERSTEQRHSA
jgi:ParB-like chromosome segregation protein Spo0J